MGDFNLRNLTDHPRIAVLVGIKCISYFFFVVVVVLLLFFVLFCFVFLFFFVFLHLVTPCTLIKLKTIKLKTINK